MKLEKNGSGQFDELQMPGDTDIYETEEDYIDDEEYTEIEYETLMAESGEQKKAIIPENMQDPRELAKAVVSVLDSKKARGLKVLYVGDKTVIADYFVLCTGTSNTQLRALSSELEEKLAEAGIHPGHIEGYNEASWIIMDYASVIVHIFDRESRNFYNLEKLWGEAEEIDISELLD
mgnify:CR=1 FL=1